jgi:S-adenosylmethionine hydrolase
MRRQVSHTFHGRDVFAPAAAHFAGGADYRRAGPPLGEILALPAFRGRPAGTDAIEGQVIHVDRFGTLITTILAEQLFPRFAIELGGRVVETQVRTFAEARRGDLFCHVDSSGYIAVALNQGSAAGQLGVRRGEALRVRRR